MEKAKSQQKNLPSFKNDYDMKDEAAIADEEKGLGVQYEELKLEKLEKVSVYEKLQSADDKKAHIGDICALTTPANSDYQELQIQDKPNHYATVNPTSHKLQEGEIKCDYESIGGANISYSPDPNYQQLQKTTISKPSVYETVAPAGEASSAHNKKVRSDELPPLRSNSANYEKTCNLEAPDSGSSNLDPRLCEEFDGVPSTCTASTKDECLDIVETGVEVAVCKSASHTCEPTEVRSAGEP